MKYIAPVEVRTQRNNIKYLEELREICRVNRKNPTEAEDKLWRRVLRSRRIKEKFLRQKPIGRYILDFYCSKLLLAIEVDGDSHIGKYYQDKNRDWYLDIRGIKTIRYTNDQVINDIENVYLDLIEKVKNREKELLFSPFQGEKPERK